jgi:hypothetical protein
MISTIGDKSIVPVSGMIRRIGRSTGSSRTFTARQIAATNWLCVFTTLNEMSRLNTNWTMTSATTIEIR